MEYSLSNIEVSFDSGYTAGDGTAQTYPNNNDTTCIGQYLAWDGTTTLQLISYNGLCSFELLSKRLHMLQAFRLIGQSSS